ncbi:TIR domain-containing protein [Streptomyces sp. NPDC010273]|uniref:TIR domain-containing protein n=1 Tax=Streptomyces sp. NPDC010273 TaxID=3364829 RepID=UPI0036EBD95C
MTSFERIYANQQAERELRRISNCYANLKDAPTRHKCFISYHGADATEVLAFVQRFEKVFIPRVIGITEDDPAINSENTEYIMDTIREKYLSDSTVTIVMMGSCTWSRKFIDWEIYSSLRRGKVDRLNGLLGIELPSIAEAEVKLPDRLSENLRNKGDGDGYARYWSYPRSEQALRNCIQDAFDARKIRDILINNSRSRKFRNSLCD